MAGPLAPVAVGALGAYTLYEMMRDRMQPRSRSSWLDSFGRWVGPSFATENDKIERTERMVRGALQSHPTLVTYPMKVFGQGSSTNNTNVRLTSDLDLVAVATESVWWAPADGEDFPASVSAGPANLEDIYASYRGEILQALTNKFWQSGIDDANKTIKLAATDTSRVECDVLPCFRLHKYLPRAQWSNNTPAYWEGIIFVTGDGEVVHSFPELHLAHGRRKNVSTDYRYKQIARILKKLSTTLREQQTLLTREDLPSSFEIEAMLFNVPSWALTDGDLYDGVVTSLSWLSEALSDPATANQLSQVNNIEKLFPHWSTGFWGHGEEGPDEVAISRKFVNRVNELLGRKP